MATTVTPPGTAQAVYGKPCRRGQSYGNPQSGVFRLSIWRLVTRLLGLGQLQVAESNASGIGADHAAAVTINRVIAAPDLETVQMFIVPTERDLQYFVESGHRVIAAHQ